MLKTEQLLRRWVEAYPENLKPKLVQEKFRTDDRHWWQDIQPANFGLFWGGEIAAAELTGYLKPERYTVTPIKCRENSSTNSSFRRHCRFESWISETSLIHNSNLAPILMHEPFFYNIMKYFP